MEPSSLLLTLVVIAGNAELAAATINRLDARPLPLGALRLLRGLHDAWIALVPAAFLWLVGIGGAGVLFGGSWSAVPWGWKAWMAVCLVGAAGLVFSSLRWHFTRPPRQQLASRSQVFDIADRLGFRPVGSGKYRGLAHLPGNELFQIELVERTFELPRLPPERDGLTILHLSDTHFYGTPDRAYYDEVFRIAAETSPDIVVFTGDLLDAPQYAEWIPDTFGRLTAPLGCYFILGNHDLHFGDDSIRPIFTTSGWIDITGRAVPIRAGNATLAIGGTEEPWVRGFPDFDAVPDHAVRLLLSHAPDNLAWARRQNVDLMLSGHNHGGQIVLPLIGPVYSPSRYGVCYASGVFWRAPTLLSVSKGIAGRQPVRYRARPEVVRITLRSPPIEPAC